LSIFLYRQRDTFLHRLDPRVKIAVLIWLFFAAVLAADLTTVTGLLVLVFALFLTAESMDNMLRMALLFLLVTGMTFVLWAVFYGPAGAGAGTGRRMVYAGLMSVRFLCMLVSGLLFLSITPLEGLSNGLVLLKIPYSVAFTVSLSFRLVNIFVSTGFLIVEAQKVRGNDAARGNIIKRLKAYAPLMVPLIINGIKKAETLTLALESKGFSPENKIDISGRYKLATADIAVLFVLAISAVVIAFYRFLVK
jgi:energy-coupling factor transport system permease protein